MNASIETKVEMLRALEREILETADAQRRDLERQWALPVDARVENGKCVTGLRYVRENGRELEFAVEENDSDFDEGDPLRLSTGDPNKGIADVVFLGELPGKIRVRREGGGGFDSNERDEELTLDIRLIDLTRFLLDALKEVDQTEIGRDVILPLLLGQTEDKCSVEEFGEVIEEAEARGFNDSQQDAIASGATLAEGALLIQGPPGAGKTRVLAEIAKIRANRGECLLITAPTHRAIHQALNAIVDAGFDPGRVAKIGVPVRDPELKVDQYERFRSCPLANQFEGCIIGATAWATRTGAVPGITFDAVIFDEASQLTTPVALMAMLTSRIYLFIGDPQQLPPVVPGSAPAQAARQCIYGRLLRGSPLEFLDTTYRMNRELTEWISSEFYRHELAPAPSAADRKLPIGDSILRDGWDDVLDPERSLVWIEHEERSSRKHSLEEIGTVTSLVEGLYRRGIRTEQIAVVTPFRSQARSIRRRLRQSSVLRAANPESILIDTVERAQGQERDVVIVSMACSAPDYIRWIAKFLFSYRRLNVAISRARVKAIVVASEALLEMESLDDELNEDLEHWKRLRSTASLHSGRTEPAIP